MMTIQALGPGNSPSTTGHANTQRTDYEDDEVTEALTAPRRKRLNKPAETWQARMERLLGDDIDKITDTNRHLVESVEAVAEAWADDSVRQELLYVFKHGRRWHPEAGVDPDDLLEAAEKPKRGRKPATAKANGAAPAKKAAAKAPKATAKVEAKPTRKKLVPGKKASSDVSVERERDALSALVSQLIPKHAKLGEIRGEISGLFANSVDAVNLHKKAFRDAFKLRRQIDNDEGLKAADYLRAFGRYCDLLGIDDDTRDLFDNLDQEVGKQQGDADGAIA